jgi:hypothetical protein
VSRTASRPLPEPFADFDLAFADFDLVLAGFDLDLVDRERFEDPGRAEVERFFV